MTTVFPLGHPVELVTTSAAALEVATRRWASADLLFDVEPLRFSIVEITGTAGDLKFEPDANRFRFVAGDCVGEFDCTGREGRIRSTASELEHMIEATVLTALTWTFFLGVHAGCVMRNGRSILLCGDSGAGKSTLTFACGLAGWTVVSDNSLYWADAPHDLLVSPGTPVKLRDGARAIFGDRANVPVEAATFAPPGPLVFLSRRPGGVAARRASEDYALEYLSTYGMRPDLDHAQARRRELLRNGVWTLEYEHVEDAVAWLGSLT